jgi:GntR family transcriptional repressor for pyruvate dehydrogenase complex
MKKNYELQASSRMFEQVARQIAQYIQSERLEIGAKLPTERELSHVLEVSRSSVREGIRVLEILGFLDSRHGEGTFVANPPPVLIPYQVLGRQLKPEDVSHYYHLSQMFARQIIELSVIQNTPYHNSFEKHDFWRNLLLFISELGGRLDNPQYAALWGGTFETVIRSGEFVKDSGPFDLQELIDAFNRSDRNKLNQLLIKLADHI